MNVSLLSEAIKSIKEINDTATKAILDILEYAVREENQKELSADPLASTVEPVVEVPQPIKDVSEIVKPPKTRRKRKPEKVAEVEPVIESSETEKVVEETPESLDQDLDIEDTDFELETSETDLDDDGFDENDHVTSFPECGDLIDDPEPAVVEENTVKVSSTNIADTDLDDDFDEDLDVDLETSETDLDEDLDADLDSDLELETSEVEDVPEGLPAAFKNIWKTATPSERAALIATIPLPAEKVTEEKSETKKETSEEKISPAKKAGMSKKNFFLAVMFEGGASVIELAKMWEELSEEKGAIQPFKNYIKMSPVGKLIKVQGVGYNFLLDSGDEGIYSASEEQQEESVKVIESVYNNLKKKGVVAKVITVIEKIIDGK